MSTRRGTEDVNLAMTALLTIVVLGVVVSIALDVGEAYKESYRQEITSAVADRVANDIYTIDAYPEGEMELELGNSYKVKKSGSKINVTLESGTSDTKILNLIQTEKTRATSRIFADSELDIESFTAEKLCITKKPDEIEVRGGEC